MVKICFVKNRITSAFIILFLFCIFDLFPQCNIYSDRSHICIIGDTQHISFWESLFWDYWGENNAEKTKILFDEIASENPAFLIHLGDITFNGSNKNQWFKFKHDSKAIRDKQILIYPIMGNHEYFGNNEKAIQNYFNEFPYLANKKSENGNVSRKFLWYSLIFNKVAFVMLNSNFDELSDIEADEQLKWYKYSLLNFEKNDSILSIIVCSHHPPFTNSRIVSPSEIIQSDYLPHFEKIKKASFFFSGHCHSYEKFERKGKFFIVSGGGGGPRQKLNIDKSEREYNDKFDGPEIRPLHFCELKIESKGINLTVIELKNNLRFSVMDTVFVRYP